MEDQEEGVEEEEEVVEEVVRGDRRCRRALCTEVAPENTCMIAIPPLWCGVMSGFSGGLQLESRSTQVN